MPLWFLQLDRLSSWLLLLGGACAAGLGAGALLAALREICVGRVGRLWRGRGPTLAEARREYDATEIERAFMLLRMIRKRDPDDEPSAVLMWEIGRDAGHPEQAEAALLHLIRRELERGDEVRAVQHWIWLRKSVEVAAAEPTLLLRIAPALQRAGQTALCIDALRSALPAAAASGAGATAARVARTARFLDRELAEEAIWAALADDRLDPELRVELEADRALLYADEAAADAQPAVLEVDSEPSPVANSAPASAAAAAVSPRTITPTARAHRRAPVQLPRARAPEPPAGALRTAQVLDVEPLALCGDGLRVQIGSQQRRVRFHRIEAVAAAAVAGLGERRVLVVDLLLAPDARQGPSQRVVRMRSDRFPTAHMMQPGRTPVLALRWLAETLLARCGARALPSHDALRGRPYRRCQSLADYCREVLGCEPERPQGGPLLRMPIPAPSATRA